MGAAVQRAAAKQFVRDWAGHGDEMQDAQNFWRQLLQKVYGVEDPESAISFEYKVKNDQTGSTIFIDGYIHDTQVLIALLECSNQGARRDAKKVYYNIRELFVD